MFKMTRKSSERSLSDLVALCSTDGGDSLLRNFVGTNGEDDLVLHEFFFTSNAETNKYAIKLFIQKNFHVGEEDIEVLPTGNNKALIFKFEVGKATPLYLHKSGNSSPIIMNNSPGTPPPFNQKPTDNVVYFLSVLSELDLLRHRKVVEILKKHSSRESNNTFLFVGK
jgi:hypothetical protein